ncbi:MAG: hypothetical protein ACREKN_06025 [Longimicrobiaceae bacterium]
MPQLTFGQRVAGLLVILALVAAVQLGIHLVRWYAHAAERQELAGVRDAGVQAGAEVVRTMLRLDSLRLVIDSLDHGLAQRRRSVRAYERFVRADRLPARLHRAYRSDLASYNSLVGERNGVAGEWERTLEASRLSRESYQRLSERARTLAAAIGEPYFRLPTPMEAAVAKGVLDSVTAP